MKKEFVFPAIIVVELEAVHAGSSFGDTDSFDIDFPDNPTHSQRFIDQNGDEWVYNAHNGKGWHNLNSGEWRLG